MAPTPEQTMHRWVQAFDELTGLVPEPVDSRVKWHLTKADGTTACGQRVGQLLEPTKKPMRVKYPCEVCVNNCSISDQWAAIDKANLWLKLM